VTSLRCRMTSIMLTSKFSAMRHSTGFQGKDWPSGYGEPVAFPEKILSRPAAAQAIFA
jgi:hypothetical protein